MFPVVLQALQPSETHGELLHVHHMPEIKTEIWVYEDIVHHALMPVGVCVMIHIG